jgi:hypothetical protein
MNVTRPETDDVVTQLETFVMMLPNIAMWGDLTPSRATTAAARRTDNRVAHGYLSPRCIVFSRQGRSHSGHGGPGTFGHPEINARAHDAPAHDPAGHVAVTNHGASLVS